MKKKLLALSFVEGATVMAVEICGAKLLAPIFGSSLYVWASIMGITLSALASGYFFGGYFSSFKKENANKNLFIILVLASLFTLLMPVVAYYIVPRISYLSFLLGCVLSSTALIFLPIFFLGASSPFFISIQDADLKNAGKVSGTVYAVSTAGGIVSTFVSAFYFIPAFGLNFCLLFFALLLFILSAIVYKKFNAGFSLLLIAIAYLNFQFAVKKNNALFHSESLMGVLEVLDEKMSSGDVIRSLRINNVTQTEILLNSKKPLNNYLHLFDTILFPAKSNSSKALLLGLGGGTAGNILNQKKYKVEAIELDERIIDAAKNYFFLNENVNCIAQDARYFLNQSDEKFDVIFFDVFKAEEQPTHVLTIESLIALKKNIFPESIIYINWHGYINAEDGMGTVVLYNTLIKAGYNVKLCSLNSNQNFRNIIFVVSLNPLPTLPFELNEEITKTDLVNSDNRPVLEKLNANANKKWRQNYLRYYQGK